MRKNIASFLASMMITFGLVGCGGGGGSPSEGVSDSTQVEIQDVTMTFFRSFSSGTYIFNSQEELANAWAAAPFKVYPIGLILEEPPFPVYDFSKYTVVGISHGIGAWCYKPYITAAFSNCNNLVVHYSVPSSTTTACMRSGPLVAFVLVPQIQGTVEFVQDE